MDMILLTPAELRELIKDVVSNVLEEKLSLANPVVEDQIISLNEVARLLSISKVTVHKYKKAGLIPFYRISSKVFFKRNEVLASLTKIERV